MIKLQDSQITQILPEHFSGDANVQALSFALGRAVQRLISYCGNISVFAVIDTAPDYVLDMLALELNTQYYDDSLATEVKRKLIKNTLVWYMSAGTPKAVEELVVVAFGKGIVKEWFEYGGEPYHFKIQTDAVLRENMLTYFQSMIRKVKNSRSHMESIEIFHTVDQLLYGGVGIHCQYSRAVAITDNSEC